MLLKSCNETRRQDFTEPSNNSLTCLSIDMLIFSRLGISATLILIPITFAAIGPIAQLNIVNKVISPDGFARS
jgi:hypothetical protein